jgi:uncharacterized protein (TIGR02594 family)
MTAHEQALIFLDQVHELPGGKDHPFIQWCHMLCGLGPDTPDEIAWCASFINAICFLQGLPRTKSAAARSHLRLPREITLVDARIGYDIVIFKRGKGPQPGPEVLDAPGHVGFYSGVQGEGVWILGGNQKNGVTRQWFPTADIIGIRRLKEG